MSKISLLEATKLALQGKLEESCEIEKPQKLSKNNKKDLEESIAIANDDTVVSIDDKKTEIIMGDETVTVVDNTTDDAIVDTAEQAEVIEEIPVEDTPVEDISPEETEEAGEEETEEAVEESKKIKKEDVEVSLNKDYDEMLKDIHQDYIDQGMEESFWSDLVNVTSINTDEIINWYKESFEVEESCKKEGTEEKCTESKKIQEWIEDEYDFKKFLAYEIINKRQDLKDKIDVNDFEDNEIVNKVYDSVVDSLDYNIDNALETVEAKETEEIEESKEIEAEVSEDTTEVNDTQEADGTQEVQEEPTVEDKIKELTDKLSELQSELDSLKNDVCEDGECEEATDETEVEDTEVEADDELTIDLFDEKFSKYCEECGTDWQKFETESITKADDGICIKGNLKTKENKTESIEFKMNKIVDSRGVAKYKTTEMKNESLGNFSMLTITKDNLVECKLIKKLK